MLPDPAFTKVDILLYNVFCELSAKCFCYDSIAAVNGAWGQFNPAFTAGDILLYNGFVN